MSTCKLTYKGKRYDSVEELGEELFKHNSLEKNIEYEMDNMVRSISITPSSSTLDRNQKNTELQLKEKIKRLEKLKSSPLSNRYEIANRIKQYEKTIKDIRNISNDASARSKSIIDVANQDLEQLEKKISIGIQKSPETLIDYLYTASSWVNINEKVDKSIPSDEIGKIVSKATILESLIIDEIKDYILKNADPRFKMAKHDLEVLIADSAQRAKGLDIKESKNVFVRFLGSELERNRLKEKDAKKARIKEFKDTISNLSEQQLLQIYERDPSTGKIRMNHIQRELSQNYRDDLFSNNTKRWNLNTKKITLNRLYEDKKKGIDITKIVNDLINNGSFSKVVFDELFSNMGLTTASAVNSAIAAGNKELDAWYDKNEAYLNPLIFSTSDASLRDQLVNEFINEVGEENYAKSVIEYSKKRYEEYLAEKKEVTDYYNTISSNPAIAKKNIDAWDYKNNPEYHYQYIKGNLSQNKNTFVSRVPIGMMALYRAPKASANAFDSNYLSIMSNPSLREYYHFVRNLTYEGSKVLPEEIKNSTGSNFMLAVRKNLVSKISDNPSKSLQELNKVGMEFLSSEYDPHVVTIDELGNPKYNIIEGRFRDIEREIEKLKNDLTVVTDNSKREIIKKKINELETSFRLDPVQSVLNYINVLETYKTKASIEDFMILGNSLVQRAKEATNYGLKDGANQTKDSVQYTIQASLYNRFKNNEKYEQFSENIFSLKDVIPLLKSDKAKEAIKLRKELIALLPSYNNIVEKESQGIKITQAESDIKNNFLKLKEQFYNLGGKSISGTKIADTSIRLTQLKILAFSPMSSLHNAVFGLLTNFHEATAGEFFTKDELLKATMVMNHTMKNYLSFGAFQDEQINKVVNFMENQNITFDFLESHYGNVSYIEDKGFGWLKSSDFYMKGITVVAAMMAKDIDTGKGKAKIWDLIKENGELDENKFTPQRWKEWQEKEKYDTSQFISALIKKMHGNLDPSNPVSGKKDVALRLLGQFKWSWFAEGFNRRFGDEIYNEQLGVKTSGFYISTYKLLKNEGYTIRELLNHSDPNIRANAKRAVNEMVMYISIAAICLTLKYLVMASLDDDDDKYKLAAIRYAYNLLYKSQQDLGLYFNPVELGNMTKNPIPAISVVRDFEKAISSTTKAVFDSDYEGNPYKAWGKNLPIVRPIIQTQTLFDRNLDDLINY